VFAQTFAVSAYISLTVLQEFKIYDDDVAVLLLLLFLLVLVFSTPMPNGNIRLLPSSISSATYEKRCSLYLSFLPAQVLLFPS